MLSKQPSTTYIKCKLAIGFFSLFSCLILVLFMTDSTEDSTQIAWTDVSQNSTHRHHCTHEETYRITSESPHLHSSCPNKNAWMQALLDETAFLTEVTIVSIGCNTGDDFVSQMRDWSGNPRFSPVRYSRAQSKLFGAISRSCGEISEDNPLFVSKRKISGICVEPMPSNHKLLTTSMSTMNYTDEVTVIHAAVSSVYGVVAFPNARIGTQNLGMGVTSTVAWASDLPAAVSPWKSKTVDVNVMTLDSIAAARNISSIEFLSIDTEGNDMRVIIGSIRTIAANRVRYLEFEYHSVGRWAQSDLQDLVDLLDQLNFDCYWALNSGFLARLTRCWDDVYYRQRGWSNVACINREMPKTHAKMQQLSTL